MVLRASAFALPSPKTAVRTSWSMLKSVMGRNFTPARLESGLDARRDRHRGNADLVGLRPSHRCLSRRAPRAHCEISRLDERQRFARFREDLEPRMVDR